MAVLWRAVKPDGLKSGILRPVATFALGKNSLQPVVNMIVNNDQGLQQSTAIFLRLTGGLAKVKRATPVMESFGMQPEPEKNHAETAEFIQSMLAQLRSMAQAERLDMLAYLIEMAYLEAGEAMRGEKQGPKPSHRRSGTA